ncbi:retrovirus-related Pol polyprotein from transposon TNT 1-94 [Trichonephila clavipes]|nr:retrovirus-related Pol polyprotein from transposon TNT 1-94 [Trichonephila clavipes]
MESGLIKERDSGKLFLVAVHNRTQTLMEIITEWIEPGTTIVADCWKAYNHDVLTTEGFNHLTFNHSLIQIRVPTQILLKARGGTSDLKNLITETTDGVAAWKILKDHYEPVTKARVIQLLDQFFGTKYQPGEDVGIFISRVKTAATRLQEAGHKLDDLYIGFQLIRWLPQEFQSTVQQIYRWKEEDFRVVKIEAELILEANRLQLMKQDLEKAENAYLSSFTSKKSKTLPGATAAAHGDPNGKNDYQKKSEFDKGLWVIDTAATSHFCNDKSLFLDLKPITNMKMSLATEDKSCPVEGIGTLRFRKRAERFLSRKVIAVRTDGGLEFCNKDMDNFLTELGIKHEVTNSYTPEMNGVAERFNLTALDGIKTLLKSSEVPHKFWGEALL